MKKIETWILKTAKNEYQLHEFIKEWQGVILLLFIIRLFTSVVSIYASYKYFVMVVSPMIANPIAAAIISIFALVLIEFLTMYLLSKLFKFVLRAKWLIAGASFIGAAIMFTLSFYLSANGLAVQQSAKVDNSTIILDRFELQKQAVKDEYRTKIEFQKSNIETLKTNPAGWSNGKRTHLTIAQQNAIDGILKNIQSLESELKSELVNIDFIKNQELSLNETGLTNTAAKYYNIVAVIMIAQLLCNAALMFFSSRIMIEREKETLEKEYIQETRETLSAQIWTMCQDLFTGTIQSYFSALAYESSTPLKLTAKAKEPESSAPNKAKNNEAEPTKDGKKIGFVFTVSEPEKTISDTPHTKIVDDNRQSPFRNCAFCGVEYVYKHHKQLYCCETCRKAAYTKRTGKELHFNSKKP